MSHLYKALALFSLPSLLFASPFIPSYTAPGDISVGAEWIYFSPASVTDTLAVATTLDGAIFGPELTNRFDDYYSGYRVGASYSFCNSPCNRYISLQWSSLRASHSVDLNTSFGFDTIYGSTGRHIEAFKRFSYYALEALLGQELYSNECIDIDLLIGAHYTHIFTHSGLSAPASPFRDAVIAAERNSVAGIGPELELHSTTNLFCGFSFIADLTGAVLRGRPSYATFFRHLPSLPHSVQIARAWRTIPYANLRLALNYCFSLPIYQRGMKGNLLLGYEGLIYFNAITDSGEVPLALHSQTKNVTMQGPFTGVNFSF